MNRESPKEITKIVIAIQARSTSTRLPRKVFEMIDGKTMLERVYDTCSKAAKYLNRYTHRTGLGVHVVIVCPEGDEIAEKCSYLCPIIQGPEHDVLKRYHIAAEEMKADYIVRVTSDCPLLPDHIISKAVILATSTQSDYTSNVFPEIRTVCDGFDVEVVSWRALDWAQRNAVSPRDREHVTMFIRNHANPRDFNFCHMVGFQQNSHIKLSVDTQEDLDRVREEFEEINKCLKIAERLHGRQSIHRY